jgi:hypothetical protein
MNYFTVAHIYFAATLIMIGIGVEGGYLAPLLTGLIAAFYVFLIPLTEDKKQ